MPRKSLLLTSALLFAGCGPAGPPAGPAAAPPTAPPAITVVKPTKQAVQRVVEQPGAVFPFEETVLYSKIPGFIQTIAADPRKGDRPEYDRLIDIGSRVEAGQVLAELSVPELDEELKQKQALVRQAEAEVTQAKKAESASKAGVAAAEAKVAEAQAGFARVQALYDRWKSELDRVSRLVDEGVIDSQTRDETRNQFQAAEASRSEVNAQVASAEADVLKARADQDKSAADVLAAEARLDVARAAVGRSDAMLEYTRIKAPYAGVVTQRNANTGDYVPAGGQMGLFTIARIDPVRVVVHVPEADAGLVGVGQEVALSIPTSAGAARAAPIARASWSLTPGSRTLRVELDLPNADGAVRPGMYVYAKIAAQLPEEWSLPAAAVARVNDEMSAYLVEAGKARLVAVQLAFGDSQVTQIRRYKPAGASDWTAVVGDESFASPAVLLTDGQSVP